MKFLEFNVDKINTAFTNAISNLNVSNEIKQHLNYIWEHATPRREKTFIIYEIASRLGLAWEHIEKLCISAECMMSAAMAVDDLLDNSPTRRGVDAFHKTLAGEKDVVAKQVNLTANIMYGLMFEQFNLPITGVSSEKRFYAQQKLLEYFLKAHIGENQALIRRPDMRNYTPSDYIVRIDEKTSLLFSFCFAAPAIYKGDKIKEKLLRKAGLIWGRLLQIDNDVKDFTTDKYPEDFKEGQPNYLLLFALCHSNIAQKDKSNIYLHWLNLDGAGYIEELYDILKNSNVYELVRKEMNKMANESLSLLEQASCKTEGLVDITNFLVENAFKK